MCTCTPALPEIWHVILASMSPPSPSTFHLSISCSHHPFSLFSSWGTWAESVVYLAWTRGTWAESANEILNVLLHTCTSTLLSGMWYVSHVSIPDSFLLSVKLFSSSSYFPFHLLISYSHYLSIPLKKYFPFNHLLLVVLVLQEMLNQWYNVVYAGCLVYARLSGHSLTICTARPACTW